MRAARSTLTTSARSVTAPCRRSWNISRGSAHPIVSCSVRRFGPTRSSAGISLSAGGRHSTWIANAPERRCSVSPRSSGTIRCCGSEHPSRTGADMSWATNVRTVVRLLCLSIWLLIALYWLGVTRGGARSASEGVGVQALLFLFVLVSGLWIVSTVSSRFVRSRPLAAILLGGAVALAVFAAVGPWLLNEWIRGGAFTSYGWGIRPGYPCSALGGGAGTPWGFGTSWAVSVAGPPPCARCLGLYMPTSRGA